MKNKSKIIKLLPLLVTVFLIMVILLFFIIPPKKFNNNFNNLTKISVDIQNPNGRYTQYDIPDKDYKMIYDNINILTITKFFRYPDHAGSYQRDPYADFCFDFNGEKEYVSFGYDNECVFFISDRAFCGEEAYMYGYDEEISLELKNYIDSLAGNN